MPGDNKKRRPAPAAVSEYFTQPTTLTSDQHNDRTALDEVLEVQIEAAVRSKDHTDRRYYRNRSGAWWIRQYEKAGCA